MSKKSSFVPRSVEGVCILLIVCGLIVAMYNFGFAIFIPLGAFPLIALIVLAGYTGLFAITAQTVSVTAGLGIKSAFLAIVAGIVGLFTTVYSAIAAILGLPGILFGSIFGGSGNGATDSSSGSTGGLIRSAFNFLGPEALIMLGIHMGYLFLKGLKVLDFAPRVIKYNNGGVNIDLHADLAALVKLTGTIKEKVSQWHSLEESAKNGAALDLIYNHLTTLVNKFDPKDLFEYTGNKIVGVKSEIIRRHGVLDHPLDEKLPPADRALLAKLIGAFEIEDLYIVYLGITPNPNPTQEKKKWVI